MWVYISGPPSALVMLFLFRSSWVALENRRDIRGECGIRDWFQLDLDTKKRAEVRDTDWCGQDVEW